MVSGALLRHQAMHRQPWGVGLAFWSLSMMMAPSPPHWALLLWRTQQVSDQCSRIEHTARLSSIPAAGLPDFMKEKPWLVIPKRKSHLPTPPPSPPAMSFSLMVALPFPLCPNFRLLILLLFNPSVVCYISMLSLIFSFNGHIHSHM